MKQLLCCRRPRRHVPARKVAVGLFVATCVLADTNEVFHWGDEDSRPINPRDLTQVVGVSAGYRWYRSLALRADGTVVNIPYGEWAYDTFLTPLSNIVALAEGGQLALRADGTVVDVDTATLVWPHLTNAVAAASGGAHHLALRTDGSVFAWGDNSYGQTNLPPGLSNVVAIAAGGAHCLAVRADGTVVGWGRNNAGQASPPSGLSNVIAVAAGYDHSLALRRDGTVVAWGANRFDLNTVPAGLSNVVAIAAISTYCLALRADGTLVAWGNPLRGATHLYPPERFTNLLAVAAGLDHAVALRDGPADAAPPLFADSPWLIGTPDYPIHHRLMAKYRPTEFSSPDLPEGLELDSGTGVIRGSPQVAGTHRFRVTAANAAGRTTREYTLFVTRPLPAIQNSGLVRVPLGNAFRLQILAHPAGDWYGADGLPPGLALDPATGVISGVATAEGMYPVSLVASNRYGLGRGTLTLRVNAIIGWGSNDHGQLDAPFGAGEVTALVSGPAHVLALRADGSLLGWGAGAPIPARASNVVAVAAGYDHSVALRADGSLVGWGALPAGPYWRKDVVAVGAGEASTVILARDGALVSPAAPPGLSNVLTFSVYGAHGLALRANGAVVEWGLLNGAPPPPDLTNVTALAAGGSLSLALRADGTVIAWGAPGQPGTCVPAGLSNVVALAAGRAHALALRADGTVVAWGDNSRGQIDVPAGLTNVALIAAAEDHSLALVRPLDDFAPPRFQPPASLVATLDHPYQFRLTVAGDVSGYGAEGLPAGLSLDPASGLVQGVPRADGQFPVVFTVTNANGVTRREVTLWVNRALPAIHSRGRMYAVVGQPFTYAVQADYAPTWYGAWNLPPGCRLDVRTGLISGTPTRAGTYLVGLVAQNVYGWGTASLSLQVGNLVHWEAGGWTVLRPGPGHAVALTPPVGLISAFTYFYQPLALMDDGRVFAIYPSGAASPISGLTNVAALATGSAGQTLALLDDGRMQAGGAGSSVDRGLDRVPPGVSNVVAIAAGGLHNLVLRADGMVFGWGRFKPIPTDLRPVIAIGAGESGDSLAVLADGTAVYWDGDPPELRATGLSNVVAVAGGWIAGYALLRDGTLYELRAGNPIPTGLSRVVTMAATPGQVLALLEDGTLAYQGPAGVDNPGAGVDKKRLHHRPWSVCLGFRPARAVPGRPGAARRYRAVGRATPARTSGFRAMVPQRRTVARRDPAHAGLVQPSTRAIGHVHGPDPPAVRRAHQRHHHPDLCARLARRGGAA